MTLNKFLTFFSVCIDKKDVIFVLDSSSSIGKDNFQYVLDFVRALVEEIGGTSKEHPSIPPISTKQTTTSHLT
jgi:hypothetical protein